MISPSSSMRSVEAYRSWGFTGERVMNATFGPTALVERCVIRPSAPLTCRTCTPRAASEREGAGVCARRSTCVYPPTRTIASSTWPETAACAPPPIAASGVPGGARDARFSARAGRGAPNAERVRFLRPAEEGGEGVRVRPGANIRGGNERGESPGGASRRARRARSVATTRRAASPDEASAALKKMRGAGKKRKVRKPRADGEPGMRAASKPRPPTHLDSRSRITLAARRRGRRETRIRRT